MYPSSFPGVSSSPLSCCLNLGYRQEDPPTAGVDVLPMQRFLSCPWCVFVRLDGGVVVENLKGVELVGLITT